MCGSCGPGLENLRHDDLLVPKGTDRSWQWPLRVACEPISSMTGWSARAQARPDVDSTEVLFEWSSAADPDKGDIVLADSSAKVLFDSTTTAAWGWEYAVYDLIVTTPEGKVDRVSQGQITLDQNVTR